MSRNPNLRFYLLCGGLGALVAVVGIPAVTWLAVQTPVQEVKEGWDLVPVVTIKDELPSGATLAAENLVLRRYPSQFVTSEMVPDEAISWILGTRTLVPLSKDEPLSFFQLELLADPARCELAQKHFGNYFDHNPPPALAADTACPQGTTKDSRKMEGRGLAPGWVMGCVTEDSRPEGPFLLWSGRGELMLMATYAAGKLDGRLESFREGHPDLQAEFREGLPHGTWHDLGPEGVIECMGRFEKGLRSGQWVMARDASREVGHWRDGRPDGEWSWFDPSGKSLGTATFERGRVRDPSTGTSQGLCYEQALSRGATVTSDHLGPCTVPALALKHDWVGPDSKRYVIDQAIRVSVPVGAPVLWEDFETVLDGHLPAAE
ncbi:MAG: hypothetical protein P1V51_04995 [Deltaproteobacteria bacterium]|nr:hypothetical protein [Deltaproteobacteria bacterium]